jgi:tetratricopeptide (TPR) repeat protein
MRRQGATVLTLLLLAGCGPPPGPSGETALFDGQLTLLRKELRDEVSREFDVQAGTRVVAIVDEDGTDVSVSIRASGVGEVVETTLRGEGVEIALLLVPQSGSVTITLHGPRDFNEPGRVHLGVFAYAPDAALSDATAQRLRAYAAWTRATRATLTKEQFLATGRAEFDTAIAAFESAGDESSAAMARLLKAHTAYVHEIDWREALAGAIHAATQFESQGTAQKHNAALARRLEAAALQELATQSSGAAPTPAEANTRARRLYGWLLSPDSPLGDVQRGRVHNFAGLLDHDTQEWNAADQHFRSALALAEKAGHRSGVLQTMRNLALLANSRGDYPAATRAYESALQDIESLPNWDARAGLLHNAAVVDTNLGNTDRAIDRFLSALKIADDHQLAPARARALHGLGVAYWARGELGQAQPLFAEALRLQRTLADDATTFAVLRSIGAYQRETGEIDAALATHQEALKLASIAWRRVRANMEIARDHAAAGSYEEALRFARAAAAEPFESATHPVHREAQLLQAVLLISKPRRNATEASEAESIAISSLGRIGSAADVQSEIDARHVLAKVYEQRGERRRASQQLSQAIVLAQNFSVTSTNPELQASSRASRSRLYRDYVDLLMSDRDDPDAPEHALRAVETVRALNYAAGAPRAENGAEDPELARLLDEFAARSLTLSTLRERSRPVEGAIRSLELDMVKLRAQIDRARARQGSAQTQASPGADAANVAPWRTVASHSVQLSYFTGTRGVYLWRRDARGLRSWRLAVSAGELGERIATLARIDPLQAPGDYDRSLAWFSRLLPMETLAREQPDVELVADSELSAIPFGLLPSLVGGDSVLGETHVISRVPTLLQIASAPARAKPRRWALFALDGGAAGAGADAGAGPPDLPAASAEIASLAASFQRTTPAARIQVVAGHRASAGAVRDVLNQGVEVMHLATHGITDLRHPLASVLWLPTAPDTPARGFLSAGQILNWRGDAGLVFLSACESAQAPARFAGEMPGLQRAFLRAGARHVVATLWPVEDEFAREFAQRFYDEMLRGTTPAQALARTQRHWTSGSGGPQQSLTRRRVAAWGYVLYTQ